MLTREARRKKRHKTIRRKLYGTMERPRLCVRRSLNHLYAQAIDDVEGKTLFAFSTRDKGFESVRPKSGKVSQAQKMGEFFAAQLKKKGIEKIALDRSGYRYHGRIKALAESLRQGGIQF